MCSCAASHGAEPRARPAKGPQSNEDGFLVRAGSDKVEDDEVDETQAGGNRESQTQQPGSGVILEFKNGFGIIGSP